MIRRGIITLIFSGLLRCVGHDNSLNRNLDLYCYTCNKSIPIILLCICLYSKAVKLKQGYNHVIFQKIAHVKHLPLLVKTVYQNMLVVEDCSTYVVFGIQ